jgi:hypothetical protein
MPQTFGARCKLALHPNPAKILGKNHRYRKTFQANHPWQDSFLVWFAPIAYTILGLPYP